MPEAPDSGRAPFAEVQVDVDRIAILKDGRQAYPSMLAAIAAAKRAVHLETYIFDNDGTGRRFAEALMERARASVQVFLMYDAWGSSIGDFLQGELRRAGVQVLPFHPVIFSGSLGRIIAATRRRNHRKSLIVDGEVAFTGGLNISDNYAAPEDGGEGWRDTHLRLEGPAAGQLERLFLETWRTARHLRLPGRFKRRPAPPPSRVRILGNDFRADRKDIRRAYLEAMTRASSRVFLTHAYFLPPAKLLRAVTEAARRGARVAVILAAATDVKVVLYAARGLYPKLLRAGVEVYEWQGRVLHAKTAVVDGAWATVGSSNLDALSLRQNLEVNAVVDDAAFASAMERMFLADLEFCERITPETVRGYGLLHRLVQWVAYQFRTWL